MSGNSKPWLELGQCRVTKFSKTGVSKIKTKTFCDSGGRCACFRSGMISAPPSGFEKNHSTLKTVSTWISAPCFTRAVFLFCGISASNRSLWSPRSHAHVWMKCPQRSNHLPAFNAQSKICIDSLLPQFHWIRILAPH